MEIQVLKKLKALRSKLYLNCNGNKHSILNNQKGKCHCIWYEVSLWNTCSTLCKLSDKSILGPNVGDYLHFIYRNELEVNDTTDINELDREQQTLASPDILAIKGLANFEKFPAVIALSKLIDNWHVSDIHVNEARNIQQADYAEHLSTLGENLSNVIVFSSLKYCSLSFIL